MTNQNTIDLNLLKNKIINLAVEKKYFGPFGKGKVVFSLRSNQMTLEEALARENRAITSEVFNNLVYQSLGLPEANLRSRDISEEVRMLLPDRVLTTKQALAFALENDTLKVALWNPYIPGLLEALSSVRYKIEWYQAKKEDIAEAYRFTKKVEKDSLETEEVQLAQDISISSLSERNQEILDFLLQQKLVQLSDLHGLNLDSDPRLEIILINASKITEKTYYAALCNRFDYNYESHIEDMIGIDIISKEQAMEWGCIVIRKLERGFLAYTIDPIKAETLTQELEIEKFVVIHPSYFNDLFQRTYENQRKVTVAEAYTILGIFSESQVRGFENNNQGLAQLEETLQPSEMQKAKARSYSTKAPFKEISINDIDRKLAIKLIDDLKPAFCVAAQMIPWKRHEDMYYILTAKGLAKEAITKIERNCGGAKIKVFIALESTVKNFYAEIYLRSESARQLALEDDKHRVNQGNRLDNDMNANAAQKFAGTLFNEAYTRNASDIHIEPGKNEYIIRIRIDGELVKYIEQPDQSNVTVARIVTAIKIEAKMEPTKKKVPQDGKLLFKLAGDSEVEMRINTLPTAFGEKMVIRIMGNNEKLQNIDRLDLLPTNLHTIKQILKSKSGIVIVTGPTGHGKSNTLYAMLRMLNTLERSIVSIENPIEVTIKGITQVQVTAKEENGVTFATGLKAIMRQDPDIIFIGEIRDAETAHIAMEAANTGHLVVATLHTNDAPSAIDRLRQLGVENYKIGANLRGVLAQRLTRRPCFNCQEKRFPSTSDATMDHFPKILNLIKVQRSLQKEQGLAVYPRPENPIFEWVGKGCEECNQKGYRGRIAIHQLMVITPELEEAINQELPQNRLKEIARNQGMLSLREDALVKALVGLTTLHEANSQTDAMVIENVSAANAVAKASVSLEEMIAPNQT